MMSNQLVAEKNVKKQVVSHMVDAFASELPQGPHVCHATLQRLEAEISSQALTRVLGVFRNEVLKRVGIIIDARDREDLQRLHVCVHALKSSALSFGCLPLSAACLQMEDFCNQSQGERAFGACDALLSLIDATLVALDEFEHHR